MSVDDISQMEENLKHRRSDLLVLLPYSKHEFLKTDSPLSTECCSKCNLIRSVIYEDFYTWPGASGEWKKITDKNNVPCINFDHMSLDVFPCSDGVFYERGIWYGEIVSRYRAREKTYYQLKQEIEKLK